MNINNCLYLVKKKWIGLFSFVPYLLPICFKSVKFLAKGEAYVLKIEYRENKTEMKEERRNAW